MGVGIPLRDDFDAVTLRRLAKQSGGSNQTRRLLSLATIYDGGKRLEAARIGGVTLQIVRDWVLRFKLLSGQRSEIVGVPDLIDGLEFGAMLADKAFDANALREDLDTRHAQAITPAKTNRRVHISHDVETYQ